MTRSEILRLEESFLAGARFGADKMENAFLQMHPDLPTRPYFMFRRTEIDEAFAKFLNHVKTNLKPIA